MTPPDDKALPPGQYVPRGFPVLHYGPVPRFRPEKWDFRVFGATASGGDHRWDHDGFEKLPRSKIVADFHCVTKFTIPGNLWEGVTGQAFAELAPPHPDVTHVMVWAEYGYSANIRIEDFLADGTVLATHHNGEPITPDHGYPLRGMVGFIKGREDLETPYLWKGAKWVRSMEFMAHDKRGFWEQAGYHNRADVWREERFG
jgi:DMSO/TMAO reductase YedYZ molybdopterin-dependent catalytic subunit